MPLPIRVADRVRPSNVRRLGRAAALAMAAGLAAGLTSGCSDGDEVSRAVRESSTTLTLAAGSGGGALPAQERRAALERAEATASSAAREASDLRKGPLLLIQARALAGQAALDAGEHAAAAAETLRALARVSSLGGTLGSQRRIEFSLSGFDARDSFRRIDEEISRLAEQIEEVRSGLNELQDERSKLQEQIDAERAEAERARLREADLRDRALRASAAAQPALVQEAAEARREAERAEKAAALLELTASSLETSIEQRESELATLQRLRELQLQSRQDVQARVEARDAQRRAAAADAEETADAFDDELDVLRDAINGQLMPSYEEAVGAYQQAISAAGRARSTERDRAGVLSAQLQHALAYLHLSHAETLDAVVKVARIEAEGRADATAALTELADGLAAQRDAATEASVESLDAARSALSGIRLSGDQQASLDRLTERLEALAARLAGESPAAAPAAGDAGE